MVTAKVMPTMMGNFSLTSRKVNGSRQMASNSNVVASEVASEAAVVVSEAVSVALVAASDR